jgi:hypothetical protein
MNGRYLFRPDYGVNSIILAHPPVDEYMEKRG